MINEKKNQDKVSDYQALIMIIISVLLLYLITAKFSYLYHESHVPRGDPFSYSVNFFRALDAGMKATLEGTLKGRGWYWLINIKLAFLSPLLFKEPYSICLVNFSFFLLAMMFMYKLARSFKFSATTSFLLSSVIWLFPSNYGFLHPTSLSQMQLDTAFLFMLTAAVSATISYVLDNEKQHKAIIAGILIGLSVWGRGNSLPFVLIAMFVPMLVLVASLHKHKNSESSKKRAINFYTFITISTFMSGYYYLRTWKSLKIYYGVHANIIENTSSIDWHSILNQILTFPGHLFAPQSPNKFFISLTCHAFIALSLFIILRFKVLVDVVISQALTLTSLTGFVCYFGVLAFMTIVFNESSFYAVHNFLLMQVGLTFSCFSLVAFFLLLSTKYIKEFKYSVTRNWAVMSFLTGCILSFSHYHLKQNGLLHPANAETATPQEVEHFALGLDKFLDGRTISWVWYEMYNPAIIAYYRVKNSVPVIENYTGKHWPDLFSPPYLHKNDDKILRAFKSIIEEADFIVLPEYTSDFNKNNPYPICHTADKISEYINSPEAPKLVVRWVLHDDNDVRLLVLQRESEALSEDLIHSEPLRLPYGPNTGESRVMYKALSDKAGF